MLHLSKKKKKMYSLFKNWVQGIIDNNNFVRRWKIKKRLGYIWVAKIVISLAVFYTLRSMCKTVIYETNIKPGVNYV